MDIRQPKLISQCSYYAGITTIRNILPAVIIWDADDNIGIYLYDIASSQYTEVIVKAHLSEISGISIYLGMLSFIVRGRLYRVDFEASATLTASVGLLSASVAAIGARSIAGPGPISTGATFRAGQVASDATREADAMANLSDIDVWVAELKAVSLPVDESARTLSYDNKSAKSTHVAVAATSIVILAICFFIYITIKTLKEG